MYPPHRNSVNLNKFHTVPIALFPGDEPGLPSSSPKRAPREDSSLLCEPFVDKRGLDAQRLLERIATLTKAKGKAFLALEQTQDDVYRTATRLATAGDALMSFTDPSDRQHADFTAQAFAELRTLRHTMEHFKRLHEECDEDLKSARRALAALYDSKELLLVAEDKDEERKYFIQDQEAARADDQEVPATSCPSSGLSSPSTAAVPGQAELHAAAVEDAHYLERLNNDVSHMASFELLLRILRAPLHYSRTDKGQRIIALMVLLQATYRRHRTRRRFISLRRARRKLDTECIRYQFFFFRRYVAAVRMHRRHLMCVGFYPLLGNANLASLRRGAYALHVTRAREISTVQRVFILWRQLARYCRAPLQENIIDSETDTDAFGSADGARSIDDGRDSIVLGSGASSIAERALLTANAGAKMTPGGASSLTGSASSLRIAAPRRLVARQQWWMRDAPFEYEMEEWSCFLHDEHLRSVMRRIALPVFGGSDNAFLICAHVVSRWRRFVQDERRAREAWDMVTRHDKKATKSKHFYAWMDVVSFTMMREAQSSARKALYLGVWKRYVQRQKHERRAAAAVVPLKKVQLLNRWRQRVVQLRLERVACNLRIQSSRPVAFFAFSAMLGHRQQVVFVKCWQWWRAHTRRRANFKSLIGLRWAKRAKQLQAAVFNAWRVAAATEREASGKLSSMPATVLAAIGPSVAGSLFAPQVPDLLNDCRVLETRRKRAPLYGAYHQTIRAIEALGEPPIADSCRLVTNDRGIRKEVVTQETLKVNPCDLFLKEMAPVPSFEALQKERDAEYRNYEQWRDFHTVRQSDAAAEMDAERHGLRSAFCDKHFIINVLLLSWQQHKRERQRLAYESAAAASSESNDAVDDGDIGGPAETPDGRPSARGPSETCTRALHFALAVGYPFVQPQTSAEWNVVSMERFFDDYSRFNVIISIRKQRRDDRIQRKSDMRFAAIRFAETNPFFSCHTLDARDIGFSPFKYLMEQYAAQSGASGGKKGKAKKKKASKTDVATPTSPKSATGKKKKFLVPLPAVPVRRQLPYLLRLHLHDIVHSSAEATASMLQNRYVRAKMQHVGVLMALARNLPTQNEAARNEGIAARDALLRRLTAFEEKEFTAGVLAHKIHTLVDLDVAAGYEKANVRFEILNLAGFNPKFLRGNLQQKTRAIGKKRDFMRRTGVWFDRVLESRVSMLPVYEWSAKRAQLERMIEEEEEERERRESISASRSPAAAALEVSTRGDRTPSGSRSAREDALPTPASDPLDVNNGEGATEPAKSSVVEKESAPHWRRAAAEPTPLDPLTLLLNDDDETVRIPRLSSCVHLSEAVAVLERNKLLTEIHVKLPASCPDSPSPRVLEVLPPRAKTPLVEEANNFEVEEEPAAALSLATLALPEEETQEPDPALADAHESASDAAASELADGVADTPRTALRKQILQAAAEDMGSSDDDDDDDPAQIAARKVTRSGKAARTLAERERSRSSIFASRSQSNLLASAKMDPKEKSSIGRLAEDDEEMIGDGGQDAATVAAFACAALHNDALDATDTWMVGAEAIEEGLHKLADGSFRVKDGTRLVPGLVAKVVLPSGEVVVSGQGVEGGAESSETFHVLPNGRVKLSDGKIVPAEYLELVGGTLRLQQGCFVLADGSVVRMDGKTYRVDGKVRLANGRLVAANKVAVGTDGKLVIASEAFLVQTKPSGGSSRRPSSAGSNSSRSSSRPDDAASDEEFVTPRSGGRAAGSSSVAWNRARDKSRRIKCPRLWGETEADAFVPAMERLLEISGRFNQYLNTTTKRQLNALKNQVLKTIAKLDPAAAKAESEVNMAARRLSRLGAGRGCADAESGSPVVRQVPSTEFQMDANSSAPPLGGFTRPATVTIESARRRGAPAADSKATVRGATAPVAASVAVNICGAEAKKPGGKPVASCHAAQAPVAAAGPPSAEAAGSSDQQHYYQPVDLRPAGHRGPAEARMVLVDTAPMRQGSLSHVSDAEKHVMAMMQSTADLINDVSLLPVAASGGIPTIHASLSAQYTTETLATSAVAKELLRKHTRKTSATATPPVQESKVASRLRGEVVKAPPSNEEQEFNQWLEDQRKHLGHPATYDTARDALQLQLGMLRHQETTLSALSSGSALAAQMHKRIQQVATLLSDAPHRPGPRTTSALFDSAIEKRSFAPQRPVSTPLILAGRGTSAGTPSLLSVGRDDAKAAVVVPPETTPSLTDAEVGRLVTFLQQSATVKQR